VFDPKEIMAFAAPDHLPQGDGIEAGEDFDA
jgi:hypothetical protein